MAASSMTCPRDVLWISGMCASWRVKKVQVLGSYWHGVDRHPALIIEDQDDDFEDIVGPIGATDEEPARRVIVAEIVNRAMVVDGVSDVVVGASVLGVR
jgi:hypothetical protein